jgi:hypothetical protein
MKKRSHTTLAVAAAIVATVIASTLVNLSVVGPVLGMVSAA